MADDFHRLLDALGVPAQLGDALLAALRRGHDVVVPADRPSNTWICRRCNSWVGYAPGAGVRQSISIGQSCVAACRRLCRAGLASEVARAWLTEHDRTEARR